MRKVELRIVGGATGTEVFVDGRRQEEVRRVVLEHEAGKLPVLTIERHAAGSAEGEAEVRFGAGFPDGTKLRAHLVGPAGERFGETACSMREIPGGMRLDFARGMEFRTVSRVDVLED
jgi:hypothetical protein